MSRPRTKGVTIEDVAQEAEVSVATVSRALRGLANVAPMTRDRVQTAATRLGYVADPHASRLATGRTNTIAMGVPVLNHWYNSQVVAGAEAVLAEAGMDLLLTSVPTAPARTRFVTKTAHRKRADGLILLDIRLTDTEIGHLLDTEARVATIGWRHPRFPSVTIDQRAAATTAVEHLIGLGHQRIGLISGLAGGPLAFSVPLERRTAYHDTLEGAGLEHGPELEGVGNFTVGGGREAMTALLDSKVPPTAVFAMSDEMAFGALIAIREAGLRVPDDVAIVGFDDHDLAPVVDLTTVNQCIEDHGAAAARALLENLDSGEIATVTVPTRLVARGSTSA